MTAGQIAVGGDAAWFSHGVNWSGGPGANSAGQVFWRGSSGNVEDGWGFKLTAGVTFTFSLRTSALPKGMVENWAPTGTYGEIERDFFLGGGVSWSVDDGSITINLKSSVGFAWYSGHGRSTDSTIASGARICQALPAPAGN